VVFGMHDFILKSSILLETLILKTLKLYLALTILTLRSLQWFWQLQNEVVQTKHDLFYICNLLKNEPKLVI